MGALHQLSAVGQKTAKVVLGNAFGLFDGHDRAGLGKLAISTP